MAIEVSGEILRLLNILSVRAHGTTQYELTVLEGVSTNVIYKAVMLDLVCAHLPSDEERATYRHNLLDAGRALLSPDENVSKRGDYARHSPDHLPRRRRWGDGPRLRGTGYSYTDRHIHPDVTKA